MARTVVPPKQMIVETVTETNCDKCEGECHADCDEMKSPPAQTYRKSRRTVQPGEPPKRYSGIEHPRGGFIRLNTEGEAEFCWARRIKFQPDGASWVCTAHCLDCADRLTCNAYKAYRKHLREDIGI